MADARREIQQLDAYLPIASAKTLDEHMAFPLLPARTAASLLGSFGLLALALAGLGVYGVMALSVAQRTVEFGIRMALGAEAGRVVGMVMKQGMALVAVGLIVGLAIAFALTRYASSLLYGISATDVVTFAALGAGLLVAGLML